MPCPDCGRDHGANTVHVCVPPAADPDALEFAKLLIAYHKAVATFFPDLSERARNRARAYMLRHGVRYWIGPGGESITCVTCGMTSHHLEDIANRYCGNCHVFHDDEARKKQ